MKLKTCGVFLNPVGLNKYNFLAVYAGQTLDEAKEILKKVKSTGKFNDANIREMQVVLDNAH